MILYYLVRFQLHPISSRLSLERLITVHTYTLILGPDPLGHFLPIAVKSIHRKRMPVSEVKSGQTASFALKKIKRSQIRKGNYNTQRILFVHIQILNQWYFLFFRNGDGESQTESPVLLGVQGWHYGSSSSNHDSHSLPGNGPLRLHTTNCVHHGNECRVPENRRQSQCPLQVSNVTLQNYQTYSMCAIFFPWNFKICQTSRVLESRPAFGVQGRPNQSCGQRDEDHPPCPSWHSFSREGKTHPNDEEWTEEQGNDVCRSLCWSLRILNHHQWIRRTRIYEDQWRTCSSSSI